MNIMMLEDVSVTLGGKQILQGVTLSVPEGRITSIIGPNGSGKTTLLKTLCRGIRPQKGHISLMGRNIQAIRLKEFAREAAFLTQIHDCPGDVTVQELVSFGRFAHRSWWKGSSEEDAQVVDWAVKRTGLGEMKERTMGTLSGGERQRAWIAMALAQKPRVLILDEPTTYLDIAHQQEVLALVGSLNAEEKLTVIMVLHDINQAVRYSDHIVVLEQGRVFACGEACEVVNGETLRQVFGVEAQVIHHTPEGRPVFHIL